MQNLFQVPLTNVDLGFSINGKRKEYDTPRRSQRVRRKKSLDLDFISSQSIIFLVEGEINKVLNKIPILLSVEEAPKILSEGRALRDVAFWKETINYEMDSSLSNQTWTLVDLPQVSKPIKCKWVVNGHFC